MVICSLSVLTASYLKMTSLCVQWKMLQVHDTGGKQSHSRIRNKIVILYVNFINSLISCGRLSLPTQRSRHQISELVYAASIYVIIQIRASRRRTLTIRSGVANFDMKRLKISNDEKSSTIFKSSVDRTHLFVISHTSSPFPRCLRGD